MPTPNKPSRVKKLEGNRAQRGKKRIKEDPRGAAPLLVPAHLKPAEAKLFRHCMTALQGTDILCSADEALVEIFAVAWARFHAANAQVHTIGLMVQSASGPVRNPMLIIVEKCAHIMHMVGSQLGFSPAARARLASIPGEEADPMALLLGDDMDPSGAWSTPPRTRAN